MANKRKKKQHQHGGQISAVVAPADPVESGAATKRVKADANQTTGPLDFTTPNKLFETLLHPTTSENFLSEHWEKKPLLLQRSTDGGGGGGDGGGDYAAYFARLFSKRALDEWLVRRSLEFVRDVNCVRYADQRRLDLNGSGRVTAAKLGKIFDKQKATLQVHQPQRFENELWRILESLESFFGCLVGSNVYITPADAQGLPPHHDDVEVFILQLEGEKRWKLYKPLVELPQDYSGDLSEDQIGSPFMQFTLKPGDLVYFPRGTIHQADTSSGLGCSTHITISTYQRHTWGDYLLSVFPSVLQEAMTNDVFFRRGLPINFLRFNNQTKASNFVPVVDQLLRKLRYKKFLASAAMIEDFMQNRLPPYAVNRKKLRNNMPTGSMPDSSSQVRLKFAEHVCCVVAKEAVSGGDSDEEDEDESDSNEDDDSSGDGSDNEVGDGDRLPQSHQQNKSSATKDTLFVHSSLFNNRKTHMFSSPAANGNQAGFALKLPTHMQEAMDVLKRNSGIWMEASELPLPSTEDIECLLRTLWSSHLLEVQQPAKTVRRHIKP